MGSLTNYLEAAFINHLCGTAFTPPATVYLALATADPGEAATGASMNEVANSGSYARVAIAFGAAASRRVTQNAAVNFAQLTAALGTATHYAIVDSATYGAGNALAYGAFGVAKSLISGNSPSVASGEIYVEISATGSGAGFTNTLVHSMLNLMLRNVAYSQPATYLGATTTVSSDSAAGTEVSGGSYARVLVNKAGGSSPAWATVSGGATSLANAVSLPVATAAWGTLVSSAIYDAATSGNMLVYDNNTADQAVATADTWQWVAGEWDLGPLS